MSSGPFYPDNPNREARVKQLITQTTGIQASFESIEDQIKKLTAIDRTVLNNVAKAAGYPTPEQYIQAGLSTLTPAQKANYQHIYDSLVINSPALKSAMMATGMIAGIGWAIKVIPTTMVAITCKFTAFVHGIWGVLRGLVLMFKGSLRDGVAMVRTFATMVKVNWSRKLVGGADISEKAVSGLRWVKRAGSFLQWAGVMAEAALLVYTVVEGEKERDTLKNATIETCSSRFGAKKIQLLVNQSMLWTSKLTGVINGIDFLTNKMHAQENDPTVPPYMRITQKDIDTETLKDINGLIDQFDTDLKECNPDSKVLGELAILDQKDTGGSWTKEDPDLEAMQKWIAEHPFKDADGTVIPVDGPLSGNVGLVWTPSISVKANSSATEVRITGTNNDATKSQRFQAVHVSVPTGAHTALFAGGGNFKIAGTAGAELGDGTVAIQVGAGVTGQAIPSVLQKPADANSQEVYLQFDYTQTQPLVPIEVPPKGTITFVLKGKIAAEAGKSNLLVREDWWPRDSGDRVWSDCVVDKS